MLGEAVPIAVVSREGEDRPVAAVQHPLGAEALHHPRGVREQILRAPSLRRLGQESRQFAAHVLVGREPRQSCAPRLEAAIPDGGLAAMIEDEARVRAVAAPPVRGVPRMPLRARPLRAGSCIPRTRRGRWGSPPSPPRSPTGGKPGQATVRLPAKDSATRRDPRNARARRRPVAASPREAVAEGPEAQSRHLAAPEPRDYSARSPSEAMPERMPDPISRRDCLTAIAAAGAGAVVAPGVSAAPPPTGRARLEPRPILPLTATSDVFTPSHGLALDRKSTRLNSSHLVISYAVFCLKKKKQ